MSVPAECQSGPHVRMLSLAGKSQVIAQVSRRPGINRHMPDFPFHGALSASFLAAHGEACLSWVRRLTLSSQVLPLLPTQSNILPFLATRFHAEQHRWLTGFDCFPTARTNNCIEARRVPGLKDCFRGCAAHGLYLGHRLLGHGTSTSGAHRPVPFSHYSCFPWLHHTMLAMWGLPY